jgi:putative transposase
VKLARSAFYKPVVDRLSRDAPIVDALNEIVSRRARWGFWKCFTRLRADGKPWNHKRVYWVYCDMRLNLKRKAKKRLTTRERKPLLQTNELIRVWCNLRTDHRHGLLCTRRTRP